MKARVVHVQIFGQQYAIRSELDPQYVGELSAYIDDKMRSAARERKLSFSMRSPDRGAPFFWNGAPSPTARSITTSSMTPPDRPDGIVRMAFCAAYSKQRFGDGPDLIGLHDEAVNSRGLYGPLQAVSVGDNQIVAEDD